MVMKKQKDLLDAKNRRIPQPNHKQKLWNRKVRYGSSIGVQGQTEATECGDSQRKCGGHRGGALCLVATYIHTDRVREKSMCGLCTTVSMVHIGREGGRKEGNSFSQAVLELG